MAELPNFILLGAAKAGTTAFYHYLKQHPEIYMSPLKETNYFALVGEALDFRGPGDADYVNRLSITTEAAYHAQFAGVRHEKAIGEASPLYLYHPHAPARIHEAIPGARLIAILRNPVDRAYSAFLHLVRDGRETTRDFARAIALEDSRIAQNWEHIWHYLDMGRYYGQVKRYFDLFGREQIKIWVYLEVRTEPHRVLRETFEFLEVDPDFPANMEVRHNSATLPPEARPPLLTAVRQQIQRELRDDILRLQDLIGHDLSHWLLTDEAEKLSAL